TVHNMPLALLSFITYLEEPTGSQATLLRPPSARLHRRLTATFDRAVCVPIDPSLKFLLLSGLRHLVARCHAVTPDREQLDVRISPCRQRFDIRAGDRCFPQIHPPSSNYLDRIAVEDTWCPKVFGHRSAHRRVSWQQKLRLSC